MKNNYEKWREGKGTIYPRGNVIWFHVDACTKVTLNTLTSLLNAGLKCTLLDHPFHLTRSRTGTVQHPGPDPWRNLIRYLCHAVRYYFSLSCCSFYTVFVDRSRGMGDCSREFEKRFLRSFLSHLSLEEVSRTRSLCTIWHLQCTFSPLQISRYNLRLRFTRTYNCDYVGYFDLTYYRTAEQREAEKFSIQERIRV